MAELTLTSEPTTDDLAELGDSLAAFNDSDVGPSGRLPLLAQFREGEVLLAGLSGYTAWGWLYVQWLWIAETHRGQGLAGKLLAAAETEARLRGCGSAHIDTFNPQALHVYQKAGYTVFGTLPNFPHGRTRSFLCKVLG